jgi:hypothetical protein
LALPFIYPISMLLTSSDEEDNSEPNSADSDFESDEEDLDNLKKA